MKKRERTLSSDDEDKRPKRRRLGSRWVGLRRTPNRKNGESNELKRGGLKRKHSDGGSINSEDSTPDTKRPKRGGIGSENTSRREMNSACTGPSAISPNKKCPGPEAASDQSSGPGSKKSQESPRGRPKRKRDEDGQDSSRQKKLPRLGYRDYNQLPQKRKRDDGDDGVDDGSSRERKLPRLGYRDDNQSPRKRKRDDRDDRDDRGSSREMKLPKLGFSDISASG
ncbi:hypothetical protein EDB80DRAFT_693174 [Ilyonectria destructans]|nr:hypothetical protein EDB80DRAFT_693174 [Ilyonectria destructans]